MQKSEHSPRNVEHANGSMLSENGDAESKDADSLRWGKYSATAKTLECVVRVLSIMRELGRLPFTLARYEIDRSLLGLVVNLPSPVLVQILCSVRCVDDSELSHAVELIARVMSDRFSELTSNLRSSKRKLNCVVGALDICGVTMSYDEGEPGSRLVHSSVVIQSAHDSVHLCRFICDEERTYPRLSEYTVERQAAT